MHTHTRAHAHARALTHVCSPGPPTQLPPQWLAGGEVRDASGAVSWPVLEILMSNCNITVRAAL